MASTIVDLNGSGPFYVRLDVSAGAQNIPGNYTTFHWALYIGCYNNGWGTWTGNSQAWAVNIAGVTASGVFALDFRPSDSSARAILLANSSINVPHNSDGTRPGFPNYGSINTDHGSVGDGTAVTWIDAPTIPRASYARWQSPTPSTKDAGSTQILTTQRASTAFTHTMTYTFGTKSGTIGTGITDTVSWVIPMELLEEIPNTATGTGIIKTTTYSGASVIGTTNSSFVIGAPASVVPTLPDITISEAVPAIATAVGAFVQGLSKLNLAIVGAAGVYGSTISSYKIEVANQTINAVSGVTPAVIDSSGSVAVKATVTDSRGRSATRTENITVLAYSAPMLNAVSVSRASAGGVVSDDGAYFRVNINAAVSSLINGTQKNSLKYRISTRLWGATAWTLKNSTTPGGITFNSFRTVGTYSVTNAYDVLVEVYDNFLTSAIIIIIPVASVFMHWDAADGVGFGKYRENGRIDSKGDIWVRADSAVGELGSIHLEHNAFVGANAEPVYTRGTTAQRNTIFGSPSTAAQQAALANRKVTWFNTDFGWEESYYAPTGTAGLTALGLMSGTAPGWYPTGEGPFSKLYANAAQNVVAGTYLNMYNTWGTGASQRRGGSSWFTYDSPTGGVVCLFAGNYEVVGYITQQAGAGTTVTHLMRNSNSVFAMANALQAGQASAALLHQPLVAMTAGNKFSLFNGIGTYSAFVVAGVAEVRGSFIVKYKSPLLDSE